MWCDPIVEEIHKIREKYARQFNFDMDAICKDIQIKQVQSGSKLVSFPSRKPMRNRKTYANLTKISLEFPDTNPLSQLTQVYLKTALIAALYHAGKLSSKQACTVLGISRRQFEKLSACHSRVDMP